MKSTHVVSALTLALFSGLAAAQTSPQPKCFFWEPPSNPAMVIHPNFAPMIRTVLDINTTALDAARINPNNPPQTFNFTAGGFTSPCH